MFENAIDPIFADSFSENVELGRVFWIGTLGKSRIEPCSGNNIVRPGFFIFASYQARCLLLHSRRFSRKRDVSESRWLFAGDTPNQSLQRLGIGAEIDAMKVREH